MKKLLIGLFLLGLVACTQDSQLTEGQVIDKDYDPAYSYWGSVCVSYKDDGLTCDTSVPVLKKVEAEYRLKIKAIVNDKTVEEWHTVPEDQYNALHHGDHWIE